MFTIQLIIFVVGTVIIVWVSSPSLQDLRSHGFYRFVAWEIIMIMFVANVQYWIKNPFSVQQIISWALLIISLVLIIQGVQLFRHKGRIDPERADLSLVSIEKTTVLVKTGVYRYIRHPFYSSLLFLGWGIFFKNVNWLGLTLAGINTFLLLITVQKEESENIQFFGEEYQSYMEQTKMFVPFIF